MKIVCLRRENKAYGFPFPAEDSYGWVRKDGRLIVAVADGITRDPRNFRFTEENYPNPSPAKIAADTARQSLIAEMMTAEEASERSVFRAFFNTNMKAMRRLNKNHVGETDYLESDWWACVACAGTIKDGRLFYGYIGDCGVAVFNTKGEVVDKTSNDVEKASKHLHSLPRYDWGKAKWRRKVRSEYRNNLDNPHSYGALTGEASAWRFIHTGKINLMPGFYVLFYSDGMEKVILSNRLAEHLAESGINGLEGRCREVADRMKIKSEGTLVAVVV